MPVQVVCERCVCSRRRSNLGWRRPRQRGRLDVAAELPVEPLQLHVAVAVGGHGELPHLAFLRLGGVATLPCCLYFKLAPHTACVHWASVWRFRFALSPSAVWANKKAVRKGRGVDLRLPLERTRRDIWTFAIKMPWPLSVERLGKNVTSTRLLTPFLNMFEDLFRAIWIS